MMTDLSVVIVNWNTRELLAQCLQSLDDTSDGLRSEVWVVDNASTDGSATMVRERFTQVRLIENRENVGFARANNQAIAMAQGRYILLLNSDTVVLPGALTSLVNFMDMHPEAGASGAQLLNTDGTLQPSCHRMLSPWREFWRLLYLERLYRAITYPMGSWDRQSPRAVEVIKGACLILRHAALAQVGLLDESYFMYTEEIDLCYRLNLAGWALYWVPFAQVIHYGEASSRQMAEAMYVQLYRSKVQFYRKTGGWKRAAIFKTLVWLAYMPRLAAAKLGQRWFSRLRPYSQTCQRLLNELYSM